MDKTLNFTKLRMYAKQLKVNEMLVDNLLITTRVYKYQGFYYITLQANGTHYSITRISI